MQIPELSLFFFSADATEREEQKYRLLLDAAKFADEHGFSAVWTPERHFQRFGGLYGNPAVVGAALAVLTRRISIRAGSVVIPLQDPLRVAEEWAIVDNLSNGRVGIATASGWHVNDFVLSPGNYHNRRQKMYENIDVVRRLWRGEKVLVPNGVGSKSEIGILPAPIQKELPIWVTGESDETFLNAGKLGFNVLTANFALRHDLKELVRKTRIYRDAIMSNHGHNGSVALMAHTFVADTPDLVKTVAAPAMAEYIRVNIEMQREHAAAMGDQMGVQASGLLPRAVSEREQEVLIRNQVANNLHSPLSLIGTVDHCAQQAKTLKDNGVDDIACLIDFGVPSEQALNSLRLLSNVIH